MQNSKRVQRTLRKLDEIEEILSYYICGSKEFKGHFKEIRELIDELGLDKKEDHKRLAKKLKGLWKSEKDQTP